MHLKNFCLFFVLMLAIISCKKENNTVAIQYQLETSAVTGDHFFVSYVNEKGDTVTQHEHPGWKYTFKAKSPFNAYLKAEVNPIDVYVLTLKIVENGSVVQQKEVSTASGGIKTLVLSHTAN
jgi:hypothetical protein